MKIKIKIRTRIKREFEIRTKKNGKWEMRVETIIGIIILRIIIKTSKRIDLIQNINENKTKKETENKSRNYRMKIKIRKEIKAN